MLHRFLVDNPVEYDIVLRGEVLADALERIDELAASGFGLIDRVLYRFDKVPFALLPLDPEPLSVARFDALWAENRDKLPVPKSYPINRESVRKWRAALPESLALFGNIVAAHLRHVGFAEFLERLNAAADAVVAQRGDRKIMLAVDDMRKSGFWAALLVWPRIRRYVGAVTTQERMIHLDKDASKWLLVLVDDAVYSGLQLSGAFYYKPSGDWRFAVIAAALSSVGRRRLLRTLPSLYLPPTIEFQSINEIALTYADAAEVDALSLKMAGVNWMTARVAQHLIYFDHKLADATSVCTDVISQAPVEVGSKVVSFGSMVTGCVVVGKPLQLPGAVQVKPYPVYDNDHEDVCPPAFYKSINYTFGGEPFAMSFFPRTPTKV